MLGKLTPEEREELQTEHHRVVLIHTDKKLVEARRPEPRQTPHH